LLSQALNQKLKLHESITRGVGYLYNEDLYWTFNEDLLKRPPHLVREQINGNNWWVGDKHNLWCYQKIQSWIYNDTQGNIIFELTPLYSGLFSAEPEKDNILFKKWMVS
jgi:hypothetical protein